MKKNLFFALPKLASLFLLVSIGSAATAFEQDQRANSLTMQFGTDAFAAQNAFGGALVGQTLRDQLQTALNSSVSAGTTSLMFEFLGLTDFTGTNQAAFQLGVVNGLPVTESGNPAQYSGTADLDWWYRTIPGETNLAGVPVNQLPAHLTAKTLTAGPGRIAFASIIPGTPGLVMSGTTISATTGTSSKPLISTNNFPPGHLPSEGIDPLLVTFESMSAGKLKGNISAAALAIVPLPPAIAQDPTSGYTTANTLLDLLVGGYNAFGILPQVKATQPDAVDSGAPVAGAGGPYTFTTNGAKMITGCKDKNGATVDLAAGLNAAAYSSYFTFTSGRVFVLPPAPEIAVEQPAGTNVADNGTKDFGSVSSGATASRVFTIRNAGNADLTGLGITIDGADASVFTVTANPAAPVTPLGNTTFTVQFAPLDSGPKSAVLHIANNDPNENPFDIVLNGSGNGAPTDIALSSSAVPEAQPAGTAVGTLSTTDPDSGSTFTYSLVTGPGSDDNASFTISGSTLSTAAVFDFETKSTYQIRVKSTDQGSLAFEKALTISVTDLDEQPPVFSSAPSATPNPGFAKQPIAFTAAANSATPVTFTWSFGDGSSPQTGASVSHTYAASGSYVVGVTAVNATGQAMDTIQLTVLEVQAMATDKASLKFNFKKQTDSLTLSGLLVLSSNFAPTGKSISVTIGGYTKTQTFTSKGKTADTNNLFALAGKMKNGVFTTNQAKLSLSLKKQNLFTPFASFGFTDANIKTPVLIQLTALILLDGNAYAIKPIFMYTAKAGASGSGKFKK